MPQLNSGALGIRTPFLHPAIEADLKDLLPELATFGLEPASSWYDAQAFGNYVVAFEGREFPLRVVRDRSQYRVDGPAREELLFAGLFYAFADRARFESALIDWLNALDA